MANTPGKNMTPKVLADAAKKVAQGTKSICQNFRQKEMEKLGMGAVLGWLRVPQKNRNLLCLNRGRQKGDAPIVLVGKGVTFDSGGVNIKTGDHMLGMNMDMSGGAAVIQNHPTPRAPRE